MLRLRKFPVAKNSMDNRGVSKFSVEVLFVSICQRLSQGNSSLLCLRKFAVAKEIMDKRAGGYQDFPSKVSFVSECRNIS